MPELIHEIKRLNFVEKLPYRQVEKDFAENRLKRYSIKLQSEGFLVAEEQLNF